VVNKRSTERNEIEFTFNESEFNISAKTGNGFDVLLNALAREAEKFLAGAESALVTRERHRRALQDALGALRRALAPDLSRREDLLAEELRLAARALGRLTGRVGVDDVLDVIFRDFCIGK
jgi:tRNA modification GTPase